MKDRNKTCPYCNEAFYDTSKQNSGKFCSVDCRRKAKILRKKPDAVFLNELVKTCPTCLNTYTPTRANQIYCSKVCFLTPTNPHEDDYVSCLICGDKLHGRLTTQHLALHNTSFQDYTKQFGKGMIYSENAKKKMQNKTWTMTSASKEKLSASLKRYYQENNVWNKGLTSEVSKGIANSAKIKSVKFKGKGNPFYGKTHSDITKTIIANTASKHRTDDLVKKSWDDGRTRTRRVSFPQALLAQNIRNAGYIVELEVFRTLQDGTKHPMDLYIPSLNLYVEVDGCLYHKCPIHTSWQNVSQDWMLNINRNVEIDKVVNMSVPLWGALLKRVWEHDINSDMLQVLKSLLGPGDFKVVSEIQDPDLLVLLDSPTFKSCQDWTEEDAFYFWRRRGFPYYSYSHSKIEKDYNTLKTLKFDEDISKFIKNMAGMCALRQYMPHIFQANSRGNASPEAYFNDDDGLRRLIKNRMEYSKDWDALAMRTGLQLLTRAPGHFYPAWARWIMQREEAKKVMDPCAGFGGRFLAAQSLGIYYEGVDPWGLSIQGMRNISQHLNLTNHTLHEDCFEEVNLTSKDFDLVLTSPPYFDLESYSSSAKDSIVRYKDYPSWLEGFVKPFAYKTYTHTLPSAKAYIHLGPDNKYPLRTDFKRFMLNAGWVLKEEILLRIHSPLAGNTRESDLFLVFQK